MSTAHLTTAPPAQLAAAVLGVLAGADLAATASDARVALDDLDEAIGVYQAGGLAALSRRAEAEWYHVRVQFPDWDTAEDAALTQLGPRLDQLAARHAFAGWWFLRKYPCWRLRLHDTEPRSVAEVLDELTTAGVLAGWRPTIYEPETAAFGGPAGIQAIHTLFCADSSGVLTYAGRTEPGLGRRELSLLLLNALLDAAGLDWFERGDVFDRVTQIRPAPSIADAVRIEHLADRVRGLMATPVQADDRLFGIGGPVAFAASWRAAFQTAGRELGRAGTDGTLDRGLRGLLAHVVIFHWNRLGLSATTQGILARAATTAFLSRS